MNAPQYVIIETIYGEEYKIGVQSYRFVGSTTYMLLADTYYLGQIKENKSLIVRTRTNRFATYDLAAKAIEELQKSTEVGI